MRRCKAICFRAPTGGRVATWGSWSACSRTCGTGLRSRTAFLDFIDAAVERHCPLKETKVCSVEPCPVVHQTAAPTPLPTSHRNVIILVKGASGQALEAKGWSHKGCYVDHTSDRDLAVRRSLPNGDLFMTPAKCSALCKGYMYFGLQHRYQCRCGNNFGSFGKVDDQMCVAKCGGKSQYTCGSVAEDDVAGQAANTVFTQHYPKVALQHAGVLPSSVHVINGHKVVRDVHNKLCPSSFQPRNGEFRTSPGKLGCCVVDKALAAIEIVLNIRTCKRFYNMKDNIFKMQPGLGRWESTFNHGWLNSGEGPACSMSEATTLLHDLGSCCQLCCKRLCSAQLLTATALVRRLEPLMAKCENAEDRSTSDLLVAVGTASCAEAEQLSVAVVEELLKAARTMYGLGDPDLTKDAKSVLRMCKAPRDAHGLQTMEAKEREKLKREAGGGMVDLLDPVDDLSTVKGAGEEINSAKCLPEVLQYINHARPTVSALHGLRDLNSGVNPFPAGSK